MRTIGRVLIVGLWLVLAGATCVKCADTAAAGPKPAAQSSPSDLNWRYAYDDAGRLTHVVGPGGKQTEVRYEPDGTGNVQQIVAEFSDSPAVTLRFDSLGRRASMTDGSGTVRYECDSAGNLTAVRRDGAPAVRYTYDVSGRIKTLQVGDSYSVEYTYDFLGRVASMKTPAGVVGYEYLTGQGQVVRTLPNGVRTFWTFTPNGQLSEITHGWSRNPQDTRYTLLAEYTYQYRPDGLIQAIRERSGRGEGTATYEYDTVGRLVRASGSGDRQYSYEYDSVGNRLRAASPGKPAQVCTYDWAGRMLTLDGRLCEHDAAGNLTSVTIGARPLKYRHNQNGQLVEVLGGRATYRYDGEGKLIARKAADTETSFVPDPLSPIWQPLVMEEKGRVPTLVVWDGSSPLIMIQGGKAEYLLHDRLGSVRLVVDAQARVTQALDYEPFGAVVNPPVATGIAPRFAGLFWDPEGNAYLTMARAYVPEIGRFLQIDPQCRIPNGSQKDLATCAYCGGDPVNFRDLDGAAPQDLNSVWWNAFWGDVMGHLFDATRAKETLAAFSASHLAHARGSGMAAGLTATFLDIVGGYIPGQPASQNQRIAQWAWSVAFAGGGRIFTGAAGAIGAASFGRNAGSVVINAHEGNLLGTLLDLTSMGLYMGSRAAGEALARSFPPGYQHEFPFTSTVAASERLFTELHDLQTKVQAAKELFTWGKTAYSAQKENVDAAFKFGLGQLAGAFEFAGGQFLNFVGRGSYWIGANRGGDEFSWAKDSRGRFPLGDTTVGVTSGADQAAKWHDIQDWVNWHADEGTEVKVPWGNGSFKYFISRGRDSTAHNWEVFQFASGWRSDYPITDSPQTANPVDLSVLRQKYPVSGAPAGTGVVADSAGSGGLPTRIYRTDQGLPQTVHRTMVEQGLMGLAFDGNKDALIIAYGRTQEDAEAMKAVVLGYNPNARVVTKWGSADLRGADIVFEMRSKARRDSERVPAKRSRRDDIFFVPPPGGGGGGGGGGWPPPPGGGGAGGPGGERRDDDWPPPPPGGGGVLTPSQVGGVYLTGSGRSLAGVGLLDGVTLDRNGNLVLVGKAGEEIKLPPLRLDDVVTIFRSVYLHGEGPTVTIDPDPDDPEGAVMIIVHSAATEQTYVGWVLYHADRLMKGYTLGVDNITKRPVESRVPEYERIIDTMYFGGTDPGRLQKEGHWERFWILPAEVRRFGAPRRELTLFDVPLKVETRPMKWVNGKLVDDPAGRSSPGAQAFTPWFAAHYDLIAQEQFLTPPPESGITTPVPIYTELRRIALITAIAEKLRDQGVPMPFWMRDYGVRPVPFEKTTPSLRTARSKQNIEAHIFGGVELSPDDKNVKQFADTSALQGLPETEQASGRKRFDLAGFLEEGVRDSAPSAKPLQSWILSHQTGTYQAVAVPGAETQAVAPCRLEETDLVVPLEGGRTIGLVRSYNSFFDPAGPWGRGWALDLPRLDKIKVPVRRDAGQAEYQIAYELVTPLNSTYARLGRLGKVPELNGSTLQVPDQAGEFFGLADAKPEFLSGPTHELIRKDRGSWHFSKQTGNLVATEQGGFRTIYERDETGRLTRIVGMLGGQIVGAIELHYDVQGRLDRATARKSNHESTIRYEYEETGRLAGAVSDSGKSGYRYEGSWVKAVTFRAGTSTDTKAEETIVRRFEYNPRGQLLAEIDATGARTEYRVTSDARGNQIEAVAPGAGARKDSVRYDPAYRPVEAKYADGTQVSWSYPESGGVVSEVTGSEGRKTRLTESADHRQQTLELAGGSRVTGEYDTAGRLLSLAENGRALLRQEWSGDGRLAAAQNETCAAHVEYDSDGLVSRVLLAPPQERGRFQHWQETKFDSAGRPREIADYRGLHVLVDYDNSGALAAMACQREGKDYGFRIARDASGRIQAVESSWEKQDYAYDAAGGLEKMNVEKQGRNASLQYQAGLLRRYTQFDGGEMRVDYCQEPGRQSLPREIRMPNDLRLTYDYDPQNRLSGVEVGGAYRMQFAYDAQGRLCSLSQSPLVR